MAFPIKTCAVCGEEFELKPDKPGFANRCLECSAPEAIAAKSKGRMDADERTTAREANEAKVGLLVFYHLLPPPQTGWMEQMLMRGVDAVRPTGWMVADDGTLIELPPESKEISVRKLP